VRAYAARGPAFRATIESCPAHRVGTTDEVASAAAFLPGDSSSRAMSTARSGSCA
jgi:NAD(P)-dependent dehydrogenase (short-subunit alcohol dehydrogenase family)